MQTKLPLPRELHQRLTVAATDSTRQLVLCDELASQYAMAEDAVFLVSNKREFDPTDLAIRYVFTSQSGKKESSRHSTNSYISSRSNAVLGAGATMGVAPGVSFRKARMGRTMRVLLPFRPLQAGARRVFRKKTRRLKSNSTSQFGQMAISAALTKLDSRQKFQLGLAPHGMLAEIPAGAELRDENADDILRSIIAPPRAKGYLFAKWVRYFSGDILNRKSSTGMDMTRDLMNVVVPPLFTGLNRSPERTGRGRTCSLV
jgi:hypothetical protein